MRTCEAVGPNTWSKVKVFLLPLEAVSSTPAVMASPASQHSQYVSLSHPTIGTSATSLHLLMGGAQMDVRRNLS